jgi:type IV pilus assembly protein PilP
MTTAGKIRALLLIIAWECPMAGFAGAQEAAKTPSEKTKEAVEKFNNAPASIGKTLQGLRDTAKDKLRQTLGGKTPADSKSDAKQEKVDLTVPQRTPESAAPKPAFKEGSRDPFRPMTLRTKVNTRQRENLSPLERLDLSQLKVVGIIWDIKEPRAMVEDTAGLGYVVKVGTPIGSNDGKVKAIHRNQIVIEEFTDDVFGGRKKAERTLNLAAD